MSRYSYFRKPNPAFPNNHVDRVVLFCVLLMSLALAALFKVNLVRLWQVANPITGDASWGHAFYLPFVSLTYLHIRKRQLLKLQPRAARVGLLVLILGIAIFAYGICMAPLYPGLSSFVQDLGMILSLFAVVLSVFGWSFAKLALFPVGYLLCGIPWPPVLIDVTTDPLQHLAATTSVSILKFSSLDVEQVGNTIHVLSMSGPDRVLEVAEACSGLRSIVVFIAIGLAVAFLPVRSFWKSLVISLCAVPIAVLCNVMRIVGDVLLDHYVSRALSDGFYHSFTGVVLLVPGVFLFLLVARWLDRISPPRRVATESPGSKLEPVASQPQPLDMGLKAGGLKARGLMRMYIAVFSIVTAAAITFGITSHVLQLHFQKLPVPLPVPLTDLPANIGPWCWIGTDSPLDTDTETALGTNKYIIRNYLDERVLGTNAIETLRHRSDGESAVADIAADNPAASVHLSVTYYTGRVDSVSHIPERCYIGHGEAASITSVQQHWIVGGRPMDVRLVTIDAPKTTPGAIRYVAYCYLVNGREESESWRVRRSLINVFDRYAWYAKIEVATPVGDPDHATKVITDFLTAALPEIESRLPCSTIVGGTSTRP